MKYFAQQLPLIGMVESKDDQNKTFVLRTRSNDVFNIHLKATTWFESLQNLDRINRSRELMGTNEPNADFGFQQAVTKGNLIAVQGTWYQHGNCERYEAQTIYCLTSHAGYYLFEHTHWWVTQVSAMADRWLDNLFGEKRTYARDDFSALYRTNLNILGLPTNDETQEMATLSRLIYGLSSAYLLDGDERYFLAAKAGVDYQREAFRSISSDGRFCIWVHARVKDKYGRFDSLASLFEDDKNTIPLYEQIYALAGLAQYYRITSDWEVLYDISRTINSFEAMFADWDKARTFWDGYFSHIDPVTFSPSTPELKHNRDQKNWNSIGDHLPAYLINILLSLDPLPQQCGTHEGNDHQRELLELKKKCEKILEVTATLICDKFPDANGNPFVRERFDKDWNENLSWKWQQNRAIVGHNLKIAWNLTRVANYYASKGDSEKADKFFATAQRIGIAMAKLGVDQIRSGVYDAMERQPSDPSIPIQFAWHNTRDFWQQEQGILAYSIMWGYLSSREPESSTAADFLSLSRELCAYWNLYFLDRERAGIYFRISDNGTPIIESHYGDKGGHSISGYHVFELDFLIHIYHRAYYPRKQQDHSVFCLHFKPSKDMCARSINVLPDFLGPDSLEVVDVTINGIRRTVVDKYNFQIPFAENDLGKTIVVRLRQSDVLHKKLQELAPDDNRFPVFEMSKRTT